jgi:drug/metabolite transporter (DMT)-like permease
LSIVLALLAAIANATSSVLQRKANRDTGADESFRLRLILDLLREPVWFSGILAVTVGFLLQAAALSSGGLAVVEPLLALELPVTLFLAGWVFHARLGTRDWIAAGGMTAGLALLLGCLQPGQGAPQRASGTTWAVGLSITLGLVALLVAYAARTRKERRSTTLGIATGIGFGCTAALMNGAMEQYGSGGVSGILTTWQTYAMVAVGVGAMLMLQNALQAGNLVNAQPGVTLLDPVTSILWGVLAFGEPINSGLWLLGAVGGGLAMVAFALLLSRSPVVHAGANVRGRDGQGQPRDEAATGTPARPAERVR